MPGFLYKGTTGVNKIPKNFLFPLTEELGSDEQNNSFDSESNCVKKVQQVRMRKVYIQDRVYM